jgi:hypothetical protein
MTRKFSPCSKHLAKPALPWLCCSPVDAEQYEQPSTGARQPGQVRQGRGDAPTDAGAEGEGARPGAPVDVEQHEQPSTSDVKNLYLMPDHKRIFKRAPTKISQ